MRTLGAGLALFGALDIAACCDAFIAAHHDFFGLRLAHWDFGGLDHRDYAWSAAFTRLGVFGCRFAGARQLAALGPAGGPGCRFRLPDHQQLADMLDRRGVQRVADLFVDRNPFFTFVAEHADLDQLMRAKVDLDFGQNGVGQALGADEHDRFERMCLGAQLGALIGRDFEGWHGKWETRLKWRRLHFRSLWSISAGRRVRTTENAVEGTRVGDPLAGGRAN